MATLAARLPEPIAFLTRPSDRLGTARGSASDARRQAVLDPCPARELDRGPCSIPVPGIARDVQVRLASELADWEEAYQLVASSYRACGYEPPSSSGLRFTPYHVLPDTVTLVAKHARRVVATLALVPDNILLGLPMESIYGAEIRQLRQEGRRLVEATSLADTDLGLREFIQVFVTLIKLAMQYHVSQQGDTWVITVNPRHRNFYRKVLGFVPLGPCRAYPTVQDHPAEAYYLDLNIMRASVPRMYQEIFGEPLPASVLSPVTMPLPLVRYFGRHSSQTDSRAIEDILQFIDRFGSPRRWD
jgi:hypothetical protein